MTDTETAEYRQRIAYRNRDSIMPGDRFLIYCSNAEKTVAEFKMKYQSLWIDQPKDNPIKKGEYLVLTCYEQRVRRNGLGLFVDYYFDVDGVGQVIINGPDAQSLHRLDSAYPLGEVHPTKDRRNTNEDL